MIAANCFTFYTRFVQIPQYHIPALHHLILSRKWFNHPTQGRRDFRKFITSRTQFVPVHWKLKLVGEKVNHGVVKRFRQDMQSVACYRLSPLHLLNTNWLGTNVCFPPKTQFQAGTRKVNHQPGAHRICRARSNRLSSLHLLERNWLFNQNGSTVKSFKIVQHGKDKGELRSVSDVRIYSQWVSGQGQTVCLLSPMVWISQCKGTRLFKMFWITKSVRICSEEAGSNRLCLLCTTSRLIDLCASTSLLSDCNIFASACTC